MVKRNQLEDIFSKYDMTGGLNDGKIHPELCWPFKGKLNSKGIAYVSIDGKSYPGHRIVYHVMHPETFALDDARLIRHKCDNGICGNYNHMIPGTHQDNMNDAVERSRYGLTLDEINAIISLNKEAPDLTHVRIAERVSYQFKRNIARTTVSDVLSGRREQRRKGNQNE